MKLFFDLDGTLTDPGVGEQVQELATCARELAARGADR